MRIPNLIVQTLLTLLIQPFCLKASTLNEISQPETTVNLKSYFDRYGVDGCFAIYNEKEGNYIRYQPELCSRGYIPASTFKIPHSLIALEVGIIKDTSENIQWDGRSRQVKNWDRDQNLATAIRYSTVWVYEQFARQIGIEKYKWYLKEFGYGNQDPGGPPYRFWLEGDIRISADQQIDFLRKFYHHKLPVSKRSVDCVKECLIVEKGSGYTLSAKTGGGVISDNEYIMWLVGYLEKNNNLYFFAMNFISDDFGKTSPARLEITKVILRDIAN